MTGKNPGKHGICEFMEMPSGTYSLHYLDASSRRAETVWRMLNDASYTVGTLNIPFTYPPEHLDGFQISLRKSFESAVTSYANIDWSRARAFCSEVLASPQGIWINRKGAKPAGIVDESEYEPLMELIVRKLSELKDPRTGEAIVKRVFRQDEICHGSYREKAPI